MSEPASRVPISYHPEPDSRFTVDSGDGIAVTVHEWRPQRTPALGAFLWLHGMAEHARRYASFAARLSDNGWYVYAPDHRGHGLTAGLRPGIAGGDAWNGMVRDAAHLIALIREQNAGLPIIVAGYSMGSMLAQRLMQLHGSELAGAILIATGGDSTDRLPLLVAAIRDEMERGADAPSELQRVSFHEFYNIPFQPIRTLYDWLSRDDDAVDEYIADPLCGIALSTALMADYVGALIDVLDAQSGRLIPLRLPMLIQHGLADSSSPLSGVAALLHRFIDDRVQNVRWHLYPDARHDLLHETNRDQVVADILNWLEGISDVFAGAGKHSE
jgi:alpha-beta hydrolase superfamily lysophospholipase